MIEYNKNARNWMSVEMLDLVERNAADFYDRVDARRNIPFTAPDTAVLGTLAEFNAQVRDTFRLTPEMLATPASVYLDTTYQIDVAKETESPESAYDRAMRVVE